MASKNFVLSQNITHVTTFPKEILSGSYCFDRVKFSNMSKTHVETKKSVITSIITLPVTTKKHTNTTRATSEPVVARNDCSRLGRVWREVQGSNDWENLIQPLHPLLRQEVIRYGEFVKACYKAFDLDPNSKRYLTCKFGKKNMLREVGMASSGYQVTKYIYATPDIKIPIQNGPSCGRWIGYVAVSSEDATTKTLGRRDIVITFRGTVTNPEWVTNFMSRLTPARLDPHNPRPDVKVESGFLSLYTSEESEDKFGLGSCREQLLSEVSRLLNEYKDEEVSITLAGHSMGSSLALLLAYDIGELGLIKKKNKTLKQVPLTVYSFGGPRVGNLGFKKRCEELGIKVLRIVNVNDPITKLPGFLFNNENFRVLGEKYEFPWRSCHCYSHVGVELALDFFNMQNPSCVHDLESYIDLLKFPKRLVYDQQDHEQKDRIITNVGVDLLSKAKELILYAQNLSMLLPLEKKWG